MEEFTDRERELRGEFEKARKLFEEGKVQEVKNLCLKMIREDPHYLEAYILLHEIYEMEGDLKSAEKVIEEALSRIEEILPAKDSLRVPWSRPQNRHILKALITAGTFYWELGEIDRALEILKRVFSMNPSDEPGVRFYILAILEGMSLQEYEQVFVKEGKPNLEDLERWFRKHSPEHPDYFRATDV